MDKLKTVQTDLETARKDFQTLSGELPQFQTLVAENETEAEKLRKTRADLSKQAEAKGRVNVAREMLEQHQSDIASAQAEVSRLEALERSELLLLEMAGHAKTAHKHRAVVNKAVGQAVEDLQRAAQTIIREWSAFETAKDAFVSAGATELGTFMWSNDPLASGLQGDARNSLETRVLSVLEAVKERGGDVSTLLEDNVVSTKYRSSRSLPSEGLAMLVWAMVIAHPDVPHSLKRAAPKPKQPISIRYVDTLPNDIYSI